MKMTFKSIVTLFMLYCLFNSSQGRRSRKSKNSSIWLFENLNWESFNLTIHEYEIGYEPSDFPNPTEGNFNKFGVYLTRIKHFYRYKEVNECLYEHKIDNKNSTVIDFSFAQDCQFNATNESGFNLMFIIHALNPYKTTSYLVKLSNSFKILDSKELTEIASTLNKVCLERKNAVEEEAKMVAAQEARKAFINEELSKFFKKHYKTFKNMTKMSKFNKAQNLENLYTKIVQKKSNEIKTEEENAVNNITMIDQAKRKIIGPQFILKCPKLNPSKFPFDLKINVFHESNFIRRGFKFNDRTKSFYMDYEKKEFKLAIREFHFPLEETVKFIASYPIGLTYDSPSVHYIQHSTENNNIIYASIKDKNRIKFILDDPNLCGKKLN